MRRRRLRDLIRHQRRLTRRLATRHVLAQRAHPAARLLNVLGAWLDDVELAGTHRFVPPLLDAATIVDAEPAHALMSIAAEPAPDLDELDPTLTDDDIGMDAVDLPNAQTAPWPVAGMAEPVRPVAPARRPEAVDRSRPDAIDARRVAPKPATPVSSPTERAPAPNPTLRPAASVDRERSARPPAPAAATTADRPVPIVPRPDSVAARQPPSALDALAPTAPGRPSPSLNTTRSQTSASSASTSGAETGETAGAVEADVRTVPNAGDAASRESAASVPTGRSPERSGEVVENATTAESPAPVERTAHSEVLQRALGALRASGELPPTKGQPTAGRQPPAGRQTTTAPVAAPPTRAAPPAPSAPPSRVAAPSLIDRQADAPPAAARPPVTTSAGLTSDDSTPDSRSSADETLPETLSASAVSQAPSAEAAQQSVDAPHTVDAPQAVNAARAAAASLVEQPQLAAPAVRDASSDTRDPAAPSQAAPALGTSEAVAAPAEQPRRDERSAVPSPGLRVDERRQARRPAHLDRARPDAPPSTAAAASQPRDTSPPLSRGPDPSTFKAGQFQFADIERTPKDWQRLLFEATNPPRPGARREQTRVPDNLATPPGPAAPPAKPGAAQSATRSVPASPTRAQPVSDRATQRPTNAASARPTPNAVPPHAAETSQSPRTPVDDPAVPIAADEPITPAHDLAPDRRETDSPRNERQREPERPLTPAAVAAEMRAMPAAPVAPSTRRFLRPLVGIDPDTVRIHRGEPAARLADMHDADAIAVGDDIALAAGHDERDPETIALLAHELTHAARARDRRFVPPAARGGRATTVSAPDATGPTRGVVRPPSRPSAAVDAEEVLAEGVETRVRAASTHQREREQTFAVTPNADLDDAADLPLDDEPASDASVGVARAPSDSRARHGAPVPRPGDARQSPWGALPAPWEPLPATLAPSRSADSRPAASAPLVSADPSGSAEESAESSPVVHRAARGGGSAGEEPAHAEPPAQAGAAPDIDALARQVYTVLKRRLAAESRRGA